MDLLVDAEAFIVCNVGNKAEVSKRDAGTIWTGIRVYCLANPRIPSSFVATNQSFHSRSQGR